MNEEGWFRIGINGKYSEWVPYSSIAILELGDEKYYGVSCYYSGYFPVETVFTIVEVL